MTTPSVPQPTHQTRNQNPEPRNQNPENSDIRASHFQPRVWSAVWKLPALFWSVLAVAIMSDKSETPSPSLSRVFPFSTVVIVAILVMFKYERVEEMVQVIANYFDIPRDATVVLIVAFVIVLVFLAYGVWSGAYYVINLRKSRDAAGLIYIRERNALIALFNSLDGKQWKDKTRWCSNEPIERWKGVKIDHNTGRVNKLLLADNQLGGCIPEEIGELESLKEIDFRLNKIKGTIPKALSTLKKLEGKIPHDLSLLPELSGIYLYNNCFDSGESPAAAEVFKKNVKEGCIVFI